MLMQSSSRELHMCTALACTGRAAAGTEFAKAEQRQAGQNVCVAAALGRLCLPCPHLQQHSAALCVPADGRPVQRRAALLVG